MALSPINTLKEQAATFRPTLLLTITFSTGLVLRLATITCTYGGNAYLGRIGEQAIDRIQALSEQGIDRVPSLSLQIADPDAVIWTNYERVAGFKGAAVEARFVFWDPYNPTEFSSDSIVAFSGICNLPRFEAETISFRVQNKANLQKILLPIFPISKRCPLLNPRTVAQRAEAANPDSMFYPCGETDSLAAAPPCSYTKATCTQPTHFAGITYEPPQGGRSREYTSGQWLEIKNNGNEAKYGDFYPLVYGTAWVEPPVLNVPGDANYTRGECGVMAGEASQILRVVVNDVELSPATDMNGTPYYYVNKDFRYHIINNGKRSGAPNLDVPYNGQGDPYGNICAVYFVVPRRVADSASVPNVKVLLQGAKIRVYSDPSTFTTIYGDNPAWVLADVLTKTKYTYSDLDIPSFIAAAAIYAANVTYTDQYGNGTVEPRGSVSLVLRQRRSLADIIRGIRLAFGMLLIPNADGKLKLLVEGTLAEQQPAPVSGSNYNTAIASKNRAGTAANGYVAYSFDGSNILRRNGKSTLARLDRDINDLPNRVAFQFSDRDYGYAASSFALVDSDDIQRAGQEVSGGLAVEPLGINSYNAANRMSHLILAKNLRGNPLGNTNGTDFWTWETSVKGLRLQMGQIVRLSDTRAGLSNALIRLTEIQPSRDFQTIRLTGHVHNDDWYLDNFGQAADPTGTGRRRDVLQRAAYPWRPNSVGAIASDALYSSTDKTFALQPITQYAADGTPIVKLEVSGKLPVNDFAALRPPVIGTQGTTATSGGSILGSGRVYHFVVCARDANGRLSTPSPICFVAVTNVGSANTVTIPIISWDAAQTGYEVFGGQDPNAMCWQASGSGTGASSITLTSIRERDYGVPDIEFDRLLVRIKRVKHSGILGTPVLARTSTTIDIGGTWTANALAGYELSILGKADFSSLPVANFAISANNTAGVLTVSPDPTPHLAVGDVIVVRSKASLSGNTLTDANWVNPFGPTGMDPNALVGYTLRIIAGTGRGKTYTIASNTSTTITLVSTPEMDATSRYIVEEAAWLPDQADSATIDNNDPARAIPLLVPTGNYQRETLLVQAMTLDGGNNEAFETLAPVRDIYQFGAPLIEQIEAVTSNYNVGGLDQLVTVDTTAGTVTVSLPDPADVAGQRFKIKKIAGGNGLTLQPITGTIDGAPSISLGSIGDYVEVVSDGNEYLQASGSSGGGGGTSADSAWHTITYAASITPVLGNGRNQQCTLTGNITVNVPTGASGGEWMRLRFLQDGTGGRQITLASGFKTGQPISLQSANTQLIIEGCFLNSTTFLITSLVQGLPS